MRVAINGFGRIGRNVFRILSSREDIAVVAINDISEPEPLAYLLRFDSVMGRFPGEVTLDDQELGAGKQTARLLQVREPARLPWAEMKIDIVIEATGRFRTRAELQKHLDAGAGKVILTVPAKDEIDAMVVLGVNDEILKPEHRIVSNASCTTNCLAPLVKVLNDTFGFKRGVMTTVHAYTNDQRLSDWYHADLRRSRAAGENTIPTTTGAARAVGKILPEIAGRLDGMAMRVPVIDGSIVDLVAHLQKPVTPDSINTAMREAAEGPLAGVLEFCTESVVSSDIIGNPHSSIFDAQLTSVIGEHTAKVFSWYDNEWGYSSRVVDLIGRLGS
ncbi:MAG TPA: type I glyceraldehyde-3-phosphate dehydrogenase [Planctomycetes bacterium]|nr:type I glyceraldehyde-3-phosphate dehydrogenase [Planctomycetota bacterium]HIN79569.1 type I glyceraldehyde-3-phosphate dehydrogenase [Planctomycetota bacterium]